MRFNVSYDIVTPESAAEGDAEEYGIISVGSRLRDAICDLFETRTSRVGGIHAAESDGQTVRVYNGMEFETGAHESRYLHFPDNLSESSRQRILRICDAEAGFRICRARGNTK